MSTRLELIAEMQFPVECGRCNGIYDLAAVEPTAEYVDCSIWRTPCCNREEDSRPGIRRYTELNRSTGLPKSKHLTYYFGDSRGNR